MAWGDTEGGFAQGPHGGVMGGMAGGASSPGEVSDANQAEAAAAKAAKNANALKEAVKSILSSKEYRELIEKELKKNKNVLDKEIKSILDKNKKAQEEATKQAIEGGFYSSSYDVSPSAVIGAYQDDPLDGLFDTNFNLNIEAPVGLSPGYQGAVTPGVSPPSVSHDFEGLIGQQENEAEEGLKNALGVGLGYNINYDQSPHALDVIEQENIAKKFNEEEFGLPVLDDLDPAFIEEEFGLPQVEYKDVELKAKSPVVDFGTVIEDRTEFDAMMERNREIEAQKDKDFLGTDIKARTVEERTKKEQKEAEKQTYQQQYKNMLQSFIDKHKELRSKLAKEHEKEIKDWGKIRELNKALKAIEGSDQYSKAMALDNPALSWGAKILGGVLPGLSLGPTLEGYAVDAGFVDDTTPQDVIDADPTDNAPEGQTTEEQITDLKDSVEGGFWGLLGFAKKNPKIFGPLSGEELWRLVMDEDAFWNYYEQGLVAG